MTLYAARDRSERGLLTEEDLLLWKREAIELRMQILGMIYQAGSGHPGGSLSCVEILMCVYGRKLRHRPHDPAWAERDWFVLSKGHAAPALYAVLGRAGYFSTDHFQTLRRFGSLLQGHAEAPTTPGVEVVSGPLGHGFSQANGIALGLKMDGKPHRTYLLLGDGELEAGQVWEAVMTAAHYRLDKLCAIVDHNGLQMCAPVEQTMALLPIQQKFEAFGWHGISADGHDFPSLLAALDEAEEVRDRPTVIVAHTVKGKGVAFMENRVDWHGKAPKADQYGEAVKELETALAKIQGGNGDRPT